jgi:class 3 adenylate cyclase
METGSERPVVRYVTTADGVRLAYSSVGDGPPLLYVRGFNSDVEVYWDDLRVRHYFEALGSRFTTVWFDARGNGRSDGVDGVDLDSLVEDVRAVASALNPRVTIYGQGFGTPIAIAFAARYPDAVERLILYCAHATGLPAMTDLFIETMRQTPSIGRTILAHGTYPDVDAMPRKLIKPVRTNPEMAASYLRFTQSVDVSLLLGDVRVPTLVIHPQRSPVVRLEKGVAVADGIAGATLVTIASGAYNAWTDEIADLTLRAIGEFIGSPIALMPKARLLVVLVTDIVASTETAHRLGEEKARELLHRHDEVVRAALKHHSGSEVKHTGDGIMATFEVPQGALACAVDIQRQLNDPTSSDRDAPKVRIGIASGDVLEERNDIFGTTVVLAVRLTGRAEADQILVSDAVKAAAVDASPFGSHRSLALKGFPDRVRVHEVRWSP